MNSNDKTFLLNEIEHYRKLLNEKAKHTPLISQEMIDYSQKLDNLMNEYESLTKSSPILL
ncbi:hypothetical protein JCM9140_3497 [Halalkalibacter wakoensis JCM 9140]|uniref:Spo0E like sporulation regulatory protein n=1 Tax=Halalkalibacter wakoensis JCM 9140 TaxID=1236970 RepID=W4Q5U0_9BACI|nr:aspartyl-phosphate phosphatase Spo0E family protein [Halalkalibacter wakoensis]GAE27362.1 hypothetical protein JCM9140_3497 [Halalkalibacter wakoensis JCM 9140]